MIEILINLMVSDERRENRLKAVYLLGQLGFYLGAVQEHDELMFSSFKSLAKVLLAIQTNEKLTVSYYGIMIFDIIRIKSPIKTHNNLKFVCIMRLASTHVTFIERPSKFMILCYI